MRSALSRLLRSFCMANRKSAGGTAQAVEALVRPVVEAMGLCIWDVRFERRGRTGSCASTWTAAARWTWRRARLRRVPLTLCWMKQTLSAKSYYLEVGSPGLGRRLTRDEHFTAKRGEKVRAHLIRADETGLQGGGTAVRLAPGGRHRSPAGYKSSSATSACATMKTCSDAPGARSAVGTV